MNLIVELAGKTYKVSLPDRITDGQAFPMAVQLPPDGKRCSSATLLRHAGILVLRDDDGVERNLQIRRASVTRYAGEAEQHGRAEIRARGGLHLPRATIRPDLPGQGERGATGGSKQQVVRSQITGKVLKLLVKAGEVTAPNQTLLIIEAMKMENRIFCPMGGKVASIAIKEGDAVQTGKELLRITPS